MAVSGSCQRHEYLWNSIMPKYATLDYQSDDEEIAKLSLLLKATHILVSELRQKQLLASMQLKSTTDQLVCAIDNKEKTEFELKACVQNLAQSKRELQISEEKAKMFQKDAEVATAKWERLQAQVANEVERRLQEMFKTCLLQNKAATVREMMTQMYPETQLPDADATRLPVDCSAPEEPTSPHPVRRCILKKNIDLDSPEVIQPTPPFRKARQETFLRGRIGKSDKGESLGTKPAGELSVPSSPDVIGCTPPDNTSVKSKNTVKKKDNKTRHQRLKHLLDSGAGEVESNNEIIDQTVIYAKDTQDVDESPNSRSRFSRPLLAIDNKIIPETFKPGSYDLNEEESRGGCSSKTGKGNQNLSPDFKFNHSRNTVDPSTPEKIPKPSGGSPILGSSKIVSLRHPNNSVSAEKSKKISENHMESTSQKRNLSFQIPNVEIVDVSWRKTARGSMKKSVQQSIKASFSNSRLSLPKKSKKDLSKEPIFNGGQRTGKDVSTNFIHMSENEQLEYAIEQSKLDGVCNSAFEDSDTTIFIPINSSSQGKERKKDTACIASAKEFLTPGKPSTLEESMPVFQPIYASTAIEETVSNKRKSPTNSQVERAIGKPCFASTEKPSTENSALNELTALLDEEVEDLEDPDNTAPYPPETSFDRIPQYNDGPKYAHRGPAVRKKAERRNLPGQECTQCGNYFESAFGDDPATKKEVIDSCSRHRGHHEPNKTNPRFWDPALPSTQIIRQRQEQPTQ